MATISVHFVNNVLAVAASYIEEEPDTARDVLADLGAFLSYRLRDGRRVAVAEELDHVGTYMRLQQARFPGRIDATLPDPGGLPEARLVPGDVQSVVDGALGRALARPGRVRLVLASQEDALDLTVGRTEDPGDGEQVRIALDGRTETVGGRA